VSSGSADPGRQRRQLHRHDQGPADGPGPGGAGADLVALIKPQFEAGRDFVGKGGLVKDPEIIARVEREVVEFLEGSGWTVKGLAESPITGGDGQVERLVWAIKR
jgi:23S rRNA (cytidine1920-2'-O)/16S rRNA (cytidine1409-2'-O)-methyltransferase